MGLQRRDSRGQNVQPAGAPPPPIKVERDADGRLKIVTPDEKPHPEVREDERPPHPADPRPAVPPDVAGF